MHRQRRIVGLVLAATLMTALWAAPARAVWIGPDRASPAAIATSPDQEPGAGWFARIWSWCTAIVGADNGFIVP